MLQRAHIHEVEHATPRSRHVRIRLDRPLPFRAGQAVLVGEAGGVARRPYSIASGPRASTRRREIELLVGLGEDGTPGPHLPHLAADTALDVEGPFGSFAYPAEMTEPAVLFVAGGTGIAPLRAMLQDALETDQGPRVSLLYSARTPDEFAFDEELRALALEGRLRYERTATREVDPAWRGGRGRISRAQLAGIVEGPETLCFVCGPAALVHEVPGMLREIGIAPARIRIEEWALARVSEP